MDRGLQSPCAEIVVVIGIRLNSLLHARPKRDGFAPVRNADWSFATSIAVRADARRVYQALTLPEYLEAWIAMPDQRPGSSVAVFGEANGYRLIHSSGGRVLTSIAAYFLARRLRAVRLYWRKARTPVCAWGLVDLRLGDASGGCVLELRHSALSSAEEYAWHRALWQGSLSRLAALLHFA